MIGMAQMFIQLQAAGRLLLGEVQGDRNGTQEAKDPARHIAGVVSMGIKNRC